MYISYTVGPAHNLLFPWILILTMANYINSLVQRYDNFLNCEIPFVRHLKSRKFGILLLYDFGDDDFALSTAIFCGKVDDLLCCLEQ